MYIAIWNLDVDGSTHEVKLEWTYWGGDRDVYVDGALVSESKLLLRWKSDQEIEVAGRTARVITKPHSVAHAARFTVLLEFQGKELEPDRNLSNIGQA